MVEQPKPSERVRTELVRFLVNELHRPADQVNCWARAWQTWVDLVGQGSVPEPVSADHLADLQAALARHDQTLLDQQVALFRRLDRLPEDAPERQELWSRWQTLKRLRAAIDEFLFPPGIVGGLRRKTIR